MKLNRLAKFAGIVLLYNLAVIAWGAYVRASGSGAGCGSHWPLCNGQIIPRTPTLQTLIEFSHRITSGVALLLVIAMVVWAFRVTRSTANATTSPGSHANQRWQPLRYWAGLSLFFILTEALVGAALVLFEYVAENRSIGRALWMSGHLINTFLMLAAFTMTGWTAANPDKRPTLRNQNSLSWLLGATFIATLVLGVSGAITALGATLFPVTSLAEGLQQDLSPTSHILIRLRFYHPIIAMFVSVLLCYTASLVRTQRPNPWTQKFSIALIAFVFIQMTAGIANLLLHAPNWLQLIHLLLSDLIWISLVLLSASALAQQPSTASVSALGAPTTARANLA